MTRWIRRIGFGAVGIGLIEGLGYWLGLLVFGGLVAVFATFEEVEP